jgi:hypothetical protein
MRERLSSKGFAFSFFATYFAFVLITMYVFDFSSPGLGIGHTEHGFPFTYYYSHCFGGTYIWSGIFANLTIGGALSFLVALGVELLTKNLSSPEFRKRWHV